MVGGAAAPAGGFPLPKTRRQNPGSGAGAGSRNAAYDAAIRSSGSSPLRYTNSGSSRNARAATAPAAARSELDSSRTSTSMRAVGAAERRSAARLEGLDELRDDLVDVADDTEVGDAEDRRLTVLVHGDDV